MSEQTTSKKPAAPRRTETRVHTALRLVHAHPELLKEFRTAVTASLPGPAENFPSVAVKIADEEKRHRETMAKLRAEREFVVEINGLDSFHRTMILGALDAVAKSLANAEHTVAVEPHEARSEP